MPRKVTYAAFGYIDWVARIPLGKASMTVKFAGGALTKYGATPAEFTTSDPFTQQAIESSEYFRQGKIKIIRSSGSHSTHPIRHASKRAVQAEKEEQESTANTESKDRNNDYEEKSMSLEDAIFMLNSRFAIPVARVRTPELAISVAKQNKINLKIVP